MGDPARLRISRRQRLTRRTRPAAPSFHAASDRRLRPPVPIERGGPGENRSLFSLVNKEADRLSLSRRIEALRPAARKENDGSERIEMRLAGLYLKQGVQWLHALESHPGVRVENLTFRRSAKNLLDMDMTVSLSGGTQ